MADDLVADSTTAVAAPAADTASAAAAAAQPPAVATGVLQPPTAAPANAVDADVAIGSPPPTATSTVFHKRKDNNTNNNKDVRTAAHQKRGNIEKNSDAQHSAMESKQGESGETTTTTVEPTEALKAVRDQIATIFDGLIFFLLSAILLSSHTWMSETRQYV